MLCFALFHFLMQTIKHLFLIWKQHWPLSDTPELWLSPKPLFFSKTVILPPKKIKRLASNRGHVWSGQLQHVAVGVLLVRFPLPCTHSQISMGSHEKQKGQLRSAFVPPAITLQLCGPLRTPKRVCCVFSSEYFFLCCALISVFLFCGFFRFQNLHMITPQSPPTNTENDINGMLVLSSFPPLFRQLIIAHWALPHFTRLEIFGSFPSVFSRTARLPARLIGPSRSERARTLAPFTPFNECDILQPMQMYVWHVRS